MPANFIGEQAINGRPDRFLRQRTKLLHRTDHAQVESLAQARINNGHRPLSAGFLEPAQIAGYFIQWPLSRGQADAEETASIQRFQAFQKKGEKHATLVGTEGVDLVNNAVADT